MRIGLLLLFCLTGCATPASDTSLYQQLGGEAGLDAITTEFIRNIAADERVRPRFHNVDIMRFKAGFETYLCALSEGPCEYEGDSMQAIHAGHDYTDKEFNAIVALLVDAMEELDVPTGAQNRLLARLAPSYDDIVYQ